MINEAKTTARQLVEYSGEECDGVWSPGEPGWLDTLDEATWTLVDLPVETIETSGGFGDASTWSTWFDQELELAIASNYQSRMEDMTSMVEDGITDPIVAIKRNGRIYLWGGHHRVAACFKSGTPTIKCLLGTVNPDNLDHRSLLN